MARIIVAGSENDGSFAVIDFTNPAAPSVRLVNPGFIGGCRVAIGDHSAVAGDVLGDNVRMVDVLNPAVPVLQGFIATGLSGIGAIAIRGSRIAVGEFSNAFQARIVMIDFSSPMAPSLIGTAHTSLASGGSTAIGSIAF